MVSIDVSKMDMTELIFVVPGMKVKMSGVLCSRECMNVL